MSDVLRAVEEALQKQNNVLARAQSMLTDYLEPTTYSHRGPSKEQLISNLLGLLDGPDQREAQTASDTALSLLPTLRAALAPVTDEEVAGIRERHEAETQERPLCRCVVAEGWASQAHTDRATLLRRDAEREAELVRLREALTDLRKSKLRLLEALDADKNKHAYMGEIKNEDGSYVSWTTIKEIMVMIRNRARAALEPKP